MGGLSAHGLTLGAAVLALTACNTDRYAGDPAVAYRTASKGSIGRGRVVHPPGNPFNVTTVDLGRKLFFDKRLSTDGTVACSSCHDPQQGYTRTDASVPPGVAGRLGKRNPQSLYDVGYRTTMFYDGRAPSLEAQYKVPMLGPSEMGNSSLAGVVARVRALEDYDRYFAYAYGGEASEENIGKALASYQRVLVTGSNRFDRWRYGRDESALSEQEIAGFHTFQQAKCSTCHVIGQTSAEFTDDRFRRNGYAALRAAAGFLDEGRKDVTRHAADRFAFRTPTLRNVKLTPPYMHDGGLATLADVLAFYDQVGLRSTRSGEGPTGLSEPERANLLAFLQALTSSNLP